METILECPLCGSKKFEKFYEGTDMYYSKKHVRFVACGNCSLILLNPRPTEEEYGKWYKSVFQDKRRNLETVEQVVAGIVGKNKYKNKLKELIYFKKFIDKNSKCLEVGCGWGTLAKVIQDKFGCKIDVIEPSALAAKVAGEYYGLNVYNEDFNSFADKKDSKYNFIFAYHVFEHILEPNIFLEKIKKLLDKNGILLLALPDVSRPDRPSESYFHIEHCFYYSPKTIELVLNKHGFRVVKLWKGGTDMKVSCIADDSIIKTVFVNNSEYQRFIKVIKKCDKKYKILRSIKKSVYFFLSEKQRTRANQIITNIIKKIKNLKN